MSSNEFNDGGGFVPAAASGTPEFEDKTIVCIDCSIDFIWTAGEQTFFRDKQLQNPPKRCKECKQAKNERLAAITAAQASGVKQRIEVTVNCARCAATTTVPFYPSQGRPVFCRSCFIEMNPSILEGNKN
jgi:CxxC-x17-CxxC domain-containing protein